jgi:uncharacterized damage-inducible protein DinB
MSSDAGEDTRHHPPTRVDERATLSAFLRYQRETLEWKCSGLDAADLARRTVEPSAMSLLGLVRHLAEAERMWFRRVMAGEDVALHYCTQAASDADFHDAAPDPALVDQAWETWRAAVAFSEAFVAGAPDLDVTGEDPWRGPVSLRWVLAHMIEEYARHNGHADLLRERIDGAVGE